MALGGMQNARFESSEPKLSIIVAFHAEGDIAYRTLRALGKAILNFCQVHSASCEPIIFLDNVTDSRVISIIQQWKVKFGQLCQVHSVGFSSLSTVRNFDMAIAHGRYKNLWTALTVRSFYKQTLTHFANDQHTRCFLRCRRSRFQI